MKKIFLLIVMACCICSVAFTQNQIAGGENEMLAPEMRSGYQADNLIPAPAVEINKSGHELMNGVTYTYVGSFNVNDGPPWPTNPPCYTGQEAAALLFGGLPGDYAISTNPSTTDPTTITFTAMASQYGGPSFLEVPQDYKLDPPPPGYALPGGGPAVSAYVQDWSGYTNYVWRVSNWVPVSDWAIGIGIFLILVVAVIRFRRF